MLGLLLLIVLPLWVSFSSVVLPTRTRTFDQFSKHEKTYTQKWAFAQLLIRIPRSYEQHVCGIF